MFRKKEFYTALKIYAITFLGILILILGLLLRQQSFDSSLHSLSDLITNTRFLISVHVIFLVVYGLFLLTRYIVRVYRKHGLKTMSKRLSMYVILPMLVLFGSFKTIVHINGNEAFDYQWDHSIENTTGIIKDHYNTDGKHRGMSVFGWKNNNESAITTLVQNNIEWVAVIPFMYQKDESSPEVSSPEMVGKWSKRDSIFISTISELKAKGVHVHLKPHIWTGEGWRSNIKHESKAQWDTWFTSYRKSMLHYAHLAQKTGAELFCIGTELRTSIKAQPNKWKQLIQEIKTIYNGKLTYAANWDGEYEMVKFWDELDYIGIQAYFPLTNRANPDLETIKKGWDPHIETLESLSKTHKKPILFTEIGYKNDTKATIKPWQWESFFGILYRKKSNRTQQLAYQALFEKLWNYEWFAGMYIWEWNTRSTPSGTENSLDFSPRFKPAQNTIAKGYSK